MATEQRAGGIGTRDGGSVAVGGSPGDAVADTRAVELGLDALEAAPPVQTGPSVGRRLVRCVLPPIVFLAALIGIWQLACTAGVKPPYALPSPSDVGQEFWDNIADGTAFEAIGTSISRGAVGFVISLVIGTALGLAMYSSVWLRRAIGPIVSGLQSLPSVAWVPAAIIWFGFSNAAIYSVVILGAAPSIANGLLGGLRQVPPLFDRVGRVLGLTALGRIRHVLLPAALPGYLTGLRQGWAFAWRSLMAAELITFSPALGAGLGQLLNQGRELSRMSLVITSIALILVVGIAIELLVFAPIERRVLVSRGLTIG